MADLELGVSAVGVEEAVRDLGKVDTAQQGVARSAQSSSRQTQAAAQASSRSFASLGTAAQQAGQRAGQVASAIGNVGTVVAQLSPQLGTAGQAFGQVGAAASALSGSMGPLGVAIAGVTAAVGLASIALRTQRERLEDARESARRLTRSFDDLEASARRAFAASERTRRLEAGGGTIAEQRAFTAQAEQRGQLALRALQGDEGALAELRAQGVTGVSQTEPTAVQGIIASVTGGPALTMAPGERDVIAAIADRARREAERRRALEGAAQEREIGAAEEGLQESAGRVIERDRRERRSAAGTAERAAEAARREDERRRAEMTRDLLGSATAGRRDFVRDAGDGQSVDLEQEHRAALERARELAEAQRELANEASEAAAVFEQTMPQSLEEVRMAWDAANTAAQRAGRGMISQGRLMERSLVAVGNQITETIGIEMRSAFEESLTAWLDGSKSFVQAAEDMAKGVIKALTIESIVQAVTEVARGIAALAGGQYDRAPLHFAAAGAWAAVGVAAGAVGGAIGAFGGGGEKPASAGGGQDARSLGAGAVQERERTENVTINVYPGGYLTRDEVALGVLDAVNRAGRSGARLDSRLLRGT